MVSNKQEGGTRGRKKVGVDVGFKRKLRGGKKKKSKQKEKKESSRFNLSC